MVFARDWQGQTLVKVQLCWEFPANLLPEAGLWMGSFEWASTEALSKQSLALGFASRPAELGSIWEGRTEERTKLVERPYLSVDTLAAVAGSLLLRVAYLALKEE